MLTGNRADAEDLVQAAQAKTYLAWGKITITPRSTPMSGVRWSIRTYRGGAAGSRNFPPTSCPTRPWPTTRESDMAEVVRRALDRLPQRMRAAVMLRYFEDMTEPETAATLGISLGTVKSTVSRAVAKLRIDAELGEDSGA